MSAGDAGASLSVRAGVGIAGEQEGEERVVWQCCSVNCGSRCALRLHVRDGRLIWVESDTRPELDGAPQMRACLRGRSLRSWLAAPTRLDYPLRRIGPRGSGRFERISWDEALDTVASEIRRVISEYGNEAILCTYATGLYPVDGSPFERLLNCLGGFLGIYGDYSCAQLQQAMTYLYGDDGYWTGSVLGEAENAELVVLFGNSPADTRMGGAGAGWEFEQARERGGFKLVSIDPRHTETIAGHGDEWIPIRPGTDAALVAALAHVLITENLVDQEFLDTYCVGYDESTLPVTAPRNASYKSYILGDGEDGIAKTPAWASGITGIPEARIIALAREMAAAQPLFVAQGWGIQRRDNGESTARAIAMLPILTGNVGLSGTNAGGRERFLPFVVPEDPIGSNPVKLKIPAFCWLDAVERGSELTARNSGLRGGERLPGPVKLIVNHAGNCLTNQHADINRTHDVLSDDSKCEFIVCIDVHLTDSARYADIVLPDVARVEQENLLSTGSADILRGLVRGEDWNARRAERRRAWDMTVDLAERLGVRAAFEQGAFSCEDLARRRFEVAAASDPALPSFEDLEDSRLWRSPYTGDRVAYAAFRADPETRPLATPSGKIEIYSELLAEAARRLEYASDQDIPAIPAYVREREGADAPLRAEYPFQLIGYHCRQRTHSSFGNVEELNAIAPHEMQMNPIDAQRLGIRKGERVVVESERGALAIAVRITPRIMPGVLAIPQGAWHRADMDGDRLDEGGCINTLTSSRPTALARGNAQNTTLVRVRRIAGEGEGDAKALW